MTDPASLKSSPLEAAHLALGAKLVPFGGWQMPIAYAAGTVAEHQACRRDAVVFDVSHLGTVRLEGPGAFDALQSAFTNDLTKVAPGRAQYTHLLDDDGSVLDDLIIWWVNDERFDVMPNASNTARVRGAIGGVDVTAERVVLAVQGPNARAKLATVSAEAAAVKRFHVAEVTIGSTSVTVAGTGYTGEDGVELAIPVDAADRLFDALLAAGIAPAGLGARDTLRLEAALPLHGHELGAGITPLQAGLGWVVGWDKGDFPGREALSAERLHGVARRLVGIVTEGRQPPREGSIIEYQGALMGTVTSGNFSPMLGHGIALGFVDAHRPLDLGAEVTLVVRGRPLQGRVSALPFWPPKEP